MTRDEHEEKFRVIRAAAREHGYRWLASPIYQDFLTGERKLPCAPWGSITRNPYGWKGPCYLLTDGIFPTYEALLEGSSGRSTAPATTRAASTARSTPASSPPPPSRRPAASRRPSGAWRGR